MKMSLEALQKATRDIQAVLDRANELAKTKEGQEQISQKPGRVFCPAIRIYANLLAESALSSTRLIDEKLKGDFTAEEQAEAFWSTEEAWDRLLEKLDAELLNKNPVSRLGVELAEAPLKTPTDDHVASLGQVLSEQQGPKVHLVLLRHLS